MIGRPMLPTAVLRRPASAHIAAIIVVTVVLPFVPVTATRHGGGVRARSRSTATSTSERTGTPATVAATIAG